MKSTTSNIMKGIGVGMLVGGATALIGGSMKTTKISKESSLQKLIELDLTLVDNDYIDNFYFFLKSLCASS